jgi:hypothetical protein
MIQYFSAGRKHGSHECILGQKTHAMKAIELHGAALTAHVIKRGATAVAALCRTINIASGAIPNKA